MIPSSSSSNHPQSSNDARTMEEVWDDINISATSHRISAVKCYRGFILQDFLSKPYSNNNTPTSVSSPGYGSPQPQPQPMLLNLNSGPDELSYQTEGRTQNACSLNRPFNRVLNSFNSSSELLEHNTGGMRMLPVTERTGGDHRHKRMIKNRESAARSRARKQAYTNQLENEVKRLKKENAKLRRQQQQLQLTTTAQMTKKGALQRTSTAPF